MTEEPLLTATPRTIIILAGSTPEATGAVFTWYPVVAAVATAGLVYTLVTTLTDDRRAVFAALLLFALAPSNAF